MKCKFIDNCIHATGWCRSEKVRNTCEYYFGNYMYESIVEHYCNVTKLPCAYCNPVCEHRKDDCMEKKLECAICGQRYETPFERASCEIQCSGRQLVEKENALRREKQAKCDIIIGQCAVLSENIKKYNNDFNESIRPMGCDIIHIDTLCCQLGKISGIFK